MKSISKIQLILITVAATLLALASTFASAEIEKSRLDAIASDLQARVDESMLSGVVALIAQDGEIQMNQAFGYQNVEDQVPQLLGEPARNRRVISRAQTERPRGKLLPQRERRAPWG